MFAHHQQRTTGREHFVGATCQVGANDVFVARQVERQAITELFEDQGRTLGSLDQRCLDIGSRFGGVRCGGGEFFGRAIVTILLFGIREWVRRRPVPCAMRGVGRRT